MKKECHLIFWIIKIATHPKVHDSLWNFLSKRELSRSSNQWNQHLRIELDFILVITAIHISITTMITKTPYHTCDTLSMDDRSCWQERISGSNIISTRACLLSKAKRGKPACAMIIWIPVSRDEQPRFKLEIIDYEEGHG